MAAGHARDAAVAISPAVQDRHQQQVILQAGYHQSCASCRLLKWSLGAIMEVAMMVACELQAGERSLLVKNE